MIICPLPQDRGTFNRVMFGFKLGEKREVKLDVKWIGEFSFLIKTTVLCKYKRKRKRKCVIEKEKEKRKIEKERKIQKQNKLSRLEYALLITKGLLRIKGECCEFIFWMYIERMFPYACPFEFNFPHMTILL